MMLFECSPPFQAKPSVWRIFGGWRFLWGWFAITHVDFEFNEFINVVASAGAREERDYPGSVLTEKDHRHD